MRKLPEEGTVVWASSTHGGPSIFSDAMDLASSSATTLISESGCSVEMALIRMLCPGSGLRADKRIHSLAPSVHSTAHTWQGVRARSENALKSRALNDGIFDTVMSS